MLFLPANILIAFCAPPAADNNDVASRCLPSAALFRLLAMSEEWRRAWMWPVMNTGVIVGDGSLNVTYKRERMVIATIGIISLNAYNIIIQKV